jgi:hypothetical protein
VVGPAALGVLGSRPLVGLDGALVHGAGHATAGQRRG